MAFNSQPGQSSHYVHSAHFSQARTDTRPSPATFDILEWYPLFQSCQKYFLDVAQHNTTVQALTAFINIQLPFQRQPYPIPSSSAASSPRAAPEVAALRQPNIFSPQYNAAHAQAVSVIPYLRRLIAAGHDTPGVLHGFFGDDWVGGIATLLEIERRNYLFAAKSASWMEVKQSYDISPSETIPFLSPLNDVTEREIVNAEAMWSDWILMQDWMIGPRTPEPIRSSRVKREPRE